MPSIRDSFVYPFKTIDYCYIYDVNSNGILRVSEDVYNAFKDENTSPSPEVFEKIKILKDGGHLKPNVISEIKHPYSDHMSNYLERKIQGITLQVTQECNFRCKYCVYSGKYKTRTHSKNSMSFETAKKAVDFLLARSVDLDMINIGFYGGEPLLEFQLIKSVVEYFKDKCEGKKYILNMTTNATLFNDEILSFLQENNFVMLISLDGPKEIHDQNRVFASNGEGTFDTIMERIRYAKNNYPNLYKNMSFNAVVDPRLDPTCATTFFVKCEELNENNISTSIVSMNLRKGRVNYPEKFVIHDHVEAFRALMSGLGRISLEKVSRTAGSRFVQLKNMLFTMRPLSSGLPSSCHPSGPCVPGGRKLFVNVHGVFYPCENASETSACAKIGDVDNGFDLDKADALLNIGKLTEDECKKCWGIRFCPYCFLQADDAGKLSKKKRLGACASALAAHAQSLREYCVLTEQGFRFNHE